MIVVPAAVAGRRPRRAGHLTRGIVLGTAGAGLGVAAHTGASGHSPSLPTLALAIGTATGVGLVLSRRRGRLATSAAAAATQLVAHTVLHLRGGAAHSGMAATGVAPRPGASGAAMHHPGMPAMPGMTPGAGEALPTPHGLTGAVHRLAETFGLSGMLLGHVLAAVLAGLVLALAEAALLAAVAAGAWVRTWWATLRCPRLGVPGPRPAAPVDPHPGWLPLAPGRRGLLQRRGPPRGARLAVA